MRTKITLFFVCSLLTCHFISGQCDGADFEEQNGIAVIEAESVSSLSSGWRRESGASNFTGSGFLAWRGSDSFNTPGNGTIRYRVKINSPGRYRFVWRNRIGIIASSNANTEHNDAWLRIADASSFFGQRGSSIVYPRGSGRTPNPEGASSNGWFKIYTNTIDWSWSTNTSDFDPHSIFATFNSPGVYTIEISGRSNGHFIDRIVLFDESRISLSAATSTSRSETDCDGNNPPPPPPPPPGENDPPTVSITSPSNGSSLNAGSNVSINLSSSDPDGNLSQHQIFVNGTLVDTDGANYTPYIITNISSGNYTVRAVVSDTQGETDDATVQFSVGGDNPPPPPPPPSGDNNPPTVSISSPLDGSNVSAGSTVSVNLSANDTDGTVVQHQIFVNGSLVDTDGTNFTPHRITNIAQGSYTIRALVTDNDGDTGESTVQFTVGEGNPPPPPPNGDNNPPTVAITSPSNGANITAGSNVSINLSANDSDGNVVRYQIFVNGTLVDTDGANFTPHPINNIPAGSYTIRALVTDNDGATGETTIQFTVGGNNPPPPPNGDNDPPSVTIISPSDGDNVAPGSNVSVNLSANDTDGNVVQYRIFVNGTLVDTDGVNFTPHPINNIPAGDYTIRAVVTDNDGATGESTIQFSAGSLASKSSIQNAVAYPNPIKESSVNVKIPEDVQGNVGYTINDVTGAEVGKGYLNKAQIQNIGGTVKINLPDSAPSGVYYLSLQTINGEKIIPIIK